MHSEHLTNVSFSWVAFGWFVGFAVASSIILLLVGAGLVGRSLTGEAVGIGMAAAVGWAVGGFITGFKTAAAPILHGAAMALFTFVAWFAVNLVLAAFTTGLSAWEAFPAQVAAPGLIVQAVAAIAGCWAGYRYAPVRVE
jgi:hypothetical protein